MPAEAQIILQDVTPFIFLQDYMVSHFDSEIENSIFPRLPDHTLSQPRILHYEHPPV